MEQIMEMLKAMKEKANANKKAHRDQMMADRIGDREYMKQMMTKMES
jgi:hypothetical protein